MVGGGVGQLEQSDGLSDTCDKCLICVVMSNRELYIKRIVQNFQYTTFI